MTPSCPVCGRVGSRERGQPCPQCGARSWVRGSRFGRGRLVAVGAVAGALAGAAMALVTGFPAWPVIGAVIGLAVADLAAGAR